MFLITNISDAINETNFYHKDWIVTGAPTVSTDRGFHEYYTGLTV